MSFTHACAQQDKIVNAIIALDQNTAENGNTTPVFKCFCRQDQPILDQLLTKTQNVELTPDLPCDFNGKTVEFWWHIARLHAAHEALSYAGACGTHSLKKIVI
jgi:hypothetical protein